jgi:hypothetical protein
MRTTEQQQRNNKAVDEREGALEQSNGATECICPKEDKKCSENVDFETVDDLQGLVEPEPTWGEGLYYGQKLKEAYAEEISPYSHKKTLLTRVNRF